MSLRRFQVRVDTDPLFRARLRDRCNFHTHQARQWIDDFCPRFRHHLHCQAFLGLAVEGDWNQFTEYRQKRLFLA